MGLFAMFSKKPKADTRPTRSQQESKKHSYRGVRVIAKGDKCCQAAKSIANERFLLEDAPKLPLTTCDAEECHCTYQRFDDRRADIRRASDLGFDMAGQIHGQGKRISRSLGRRSEDKA